MSDYDNLHRIPGCYVPAPFVLKMGGAVVMAPEGLCPYSARAVRCGEIQGLAPLLGYASLFSHPRFHPRPVRTVTSGSVETPFSSVFLSQVSRFPSQPKLEEVWFPQAFYRWDFSSWVARPHSSSHPDTALLAGTAYIQILVTLVQVHVVKLENLALFWN